jgi:hypothetical protein
MVCKRSNQPRGFGFVTLVNPADVDTVCSMTHTVDGRAVDVKPAVARDKAPAPRGQETRKIFVGGLAAETTGDDLKEHFSKFGPVKDALVMVDRITNRSRGFGFITFGHDADMNAVVEVQEHELHGKFIDVKRALPRSQRHSVQTMGMNGGVPGSQVQYPGSRGQRHIYDGMTMVPDYSAYYSSYSLPLPVHIDSSAMRSHPMMRGMQMHTQGGTYRPVQYLSPQGMTLHDPRYSSMAMPSHSQGPLPVQYDSQRAMNMAIYDQYNSRSGRFNPMYIASQQAPPSSQSHGSPHYYMQPTPQPTGARHYPVQTPTMTPTLSQGKGSTTTFAATSSAVGSSIMAVGAGTYGSLAAPGY